VFVLERGLGTAIMHNGFKELGNSKTPEAPERFEDVLAALEKAHTEHADIIRNFSDDEMNQEHDQIHHRGQFSIYLRMVDAKVPSIYGPTADEPWM
jgi:hypothetical protein